MAKKQNIEPAQHQNKDDVLGQTVELEFIQLNSTPKDLYGTVSRLTPLLYSDSIRLKGRSQQVLNSFNDNINRLQQFRQIKAKQWSLNNWENEGGSIKYDGI